jgi:hypothetical protein
MKKIITTMCLHFLVLVVFGQESRLFSDIQQAKKAQIDFEDVSIFRERVRDEKLSKEFIEPEKVSFLDLDFSELKKVNKSQAINLVIPF